MSLCAEEEEGDVLEADGENIIENNTSWVGLQLLKLEGSSPTVSVPVCVYSHSFSRCLDQGSSSASMLNGSTV